MMRCALALTALLGVTACASGNPNGAPPGGEAGRAAPASYGVIVSRRPIEAPGERPGDAVRRVILGAVGGVAGTAGGAGADAASFEFIVREDGGQTVSVVQTDRTGLRPGERVALSIGTRVHLVRVAN